MLKNTLIAICGLSISLAGCDGTKKARPAATPKAEQENTKPNSGPTNAPDKTVVEQKPVDKAATQGQATDPSTPAKATTGKAEAKSDDQAQGVDTQQPPKVDQPVDSKTGDGKPAKLPEVASAESDDANKTNKPAKPAKPAVEVRVGENKKEQKPVAGAAAPATAASAVGNQATTESTTGFQNLDCKDSAKDDLMTHLIASLQASKADSSQIDQAIKALKALTKNSLSVYGENLTLIDSNCQPATLEKSLLEAKNASDYAQTTTKFMQQCGAKLAAMAPQGLSALVTAQNYQYPICDNSSTIKSVVINLKNKLPNGKTEKLFASLALRAGNVKRPLVVIKCGEFCAAGNSAGARDFLMQYFDQSPFHVLLVGSRVSEDFIKQNQIFSLGGYEEGGELIELGKWLQNQKDLMSKVSSLHLAGVSLGGNAALFTAQYNVNKNKVYDSVTAICPVVNLKDTLDSQFKNASAVDLVAFAKNPQALEDQLLGNAQLQLFKSKLLEHKATLDIGNQIDVQALSSSEKISALISDLALNSLNQRLEAKNRVQKVEQWNQMNDFLANYKELTTPTLVLASADDKVVKADLNALKLQALAATKKDSNLGVVITAGGDHCALSATYGAKLASTLLRTHVLNNSGEFKKQFTMVDSKVSVGVYNIEKATHVSQTAFFKVNNHNITVNLQMFDSTKDEKCKTLNPFHAPGCYKMVTKLLDITEFEKFGARVPKTQVEADRLTREFNARMLFLTDLEKDTQSPLTGTQAGKFHVMIRTAY